MALFQPTTPHDVVFEFLVEKATPQEILAFKMPQTAQERVIELLDKQDNGTLTVEERYELEQAHEADLLMMSLKARALLVLHGNP